MKTLRYITRNGKPSKAVAVINDDGSIRSITIESAYNGLRHQHMTEAFRRAIESNDTARFEEVA